MAGRHKINNPKDNKYQVRVDDNISEVIENYVTENELYISEFIRLCIEEHISKGENMLANGYQILAKRTINNTLTKDEMRNHAVFGIASESGEISGLLQKVYQGHPLDKEHLMKECGDLLWFIAELCTAEDFDLGLVMEMNIEKLNKRYKNGFSVEESLNRKEGDI